MDNTQPRAEEASGGERRALPRTAWRRLNQLLAQALEVDGAQRLAWLATLPPADADLKPVLRELLGHTASNQGNAASTHLSTAALREALSGAAPHSAEAPGTQVGPYRLLHELGVGGMGSVWLAERTDGAYQRQVALKLPRAEWTDRGLAERMARERAVLASLNHPNIAQMYEADWADDGRPYLALEYVDGEPIDAWCHNHTLAPAARARLFVDVVRAVAFAHAKLVIHRDLKPSNVLVDLHGGHHRRLRRSRHVAAANTDHQQLAIQPRPAINQFPSAARFDVRHGR
jgi:serine/threonine-protein kinase